MSDLRERFWRLIEHSFPQAIRNTPLVSDSNWKILPHTLNVTFSGHSVPATLGHLAVSKGSACLGHKIVGSHVLQAMRIPESYISRTLRFSLGSSTNETELMGALEILKLMLKPADLENVLG